MRHSTPLLLSALSWRASARFLAWTVDLHGVNLARPVQTQQPHPSDLDDIDQSLPPAPTPGPSKAVLELMLRRQDSSSGASSNTWEDSHTCGWYSGLSSKPYVCESPLSCATNTDEIVACSAAAITQFYTICLDYEAVQSGKCDTAGPKTGCCTDSGTPACGTMLWTGLPQRTMFQCFASPTVISMLDEPQFVVDASSSSAAAASASSAAASSSSAAAAASQSSAAAASASAAASRASELGGSSVTITTTLDGSSTTFTAVAGATGSVSGVTFMTSVQYTTTGSDGSSTTYTAIAENGVAGSSGSSGSSGSNGGSGSSGSGSSNTGAIAGGVIGGILGLLLLLLLLWYLLRKRKNKFSLSICGGKRKTNKEKHVHNKTNVDNDNRKYNEEKNSTYRTSDGTPPDGGKNSSGGGFSFSLGGAGKSKSKKEKNITKNYYYGDEVRNDNRVTDKRAWKDSRKYNTDSDPHSRSVTPSQQTQNFHFEVEGQGNGATSGRGSRGPSFDTHNDTFVGVAALGGRGSSKREQKTKQRLPRESGSRAQSYDSESDGRSPSPVPEAAVAGGTSRRDKRRLQRRQDRQARGEYSPEPYSPEPDSEPGYAAERARRGDRDVEGAHADADADGYGYEHGQGATQPQHVHVHVHVHDRDRERARDHDQSRGHSRTQSHGRGPEYDNDADDADDDDDEDEDELEEEERRQDRERDYQTGSTHRYHPNSGRRNMPASRSPSPPPANLTPHPDDFIGRGL